MKLKNCRLKCMIRISLHLFCFLIFMASCSREKIYEIKDEQGRLLKKIINQGDSSLGLNGVVQLFTAEGKLFSEDSYRNNLLEGERKIYENGVLYSIEHYQKGLFQGPIAVYYPDGTLKLEGQYDNNITVGQWKSYYPGGKLKEIVLMADNAENGPFEEYYENGKIKAKGNYLDGPDENGELLMYDSLGMLERKMNCTKGICTTTWKRDSI